MRVIAAFFGPYAPDALTVHVSVFSHDFKRFERLTKLATSSAADGHLPPAEAERLAWACLLSHAAGAVSAGGG
jgi:hypothetical protein